MLNEYHLQDVLDEIELEDVDEKQMIDEVKAEILKSVKPTSKKAKAQEA